MLYVHNTSQYYIISMEDFYSRTRSTHTSRLTVPYYRTVLISPSLTLLTLQVTTSMQVYNMV